MLLLRRMVFTGNICQCAAAAAGGPLLRYQSWGQLLQCMCYVGWPSLDSTRRYAPVAFCLVCPFAHFELPITIAAYRTGAVLVDLGCLLGQVYAVNGVRRRGEYLSWSARSALCCALCSALCCRLDANISRYAYKKQTLRRYVANLSRASE